MSKDQGIKGSIISACIGAAFFAVPYMALSIPVIPSAVIAVAAFGAGNLLFSENKKIEMEDSNKSFYEILNDAKKQNAEIYAMISKVESKTLQNDIKEVHDTASKIIDAISKNPNKLGQSQSFFNYYLPVTLNILEKYDVIENQNLNSEDIKRFMQSTENMIAKINKSFKAQLSNLYQSDIIDTDAEIKVFESMLTSEGFNDIDDFNIKK